MRWWKPGAVPSGSRTERSPLRYADRQLRRGARALQRRTGRLSRRQLTVLLWLFCLLCTGVSLAVLTGRLWPALGLPTPQKGAAPVLAPAHRETDWQRALQGVQQRRLRDSLWRAYQKEQPATGHPSSKKKKP